MKLLLATIMQEQSNLTKYVNEQISLKTLFIQIQIILFQILSYH